MRHVGHSGDRLGLPGSRDMFDSRLDALGAAAQTVGLERACGRVGEFCAHVRHAHLPPRVDEALGKRETDQAATTSNAVFMFSSLSLLARGHTVCCMATATQKVYKN